MTSDFASTAPDYLSAGWLPFPLPPGQKSPPPGGVTGRIGTPPSGPDVYEWIDSASAGANIGLRMPDSVIGIDVDHYADKTGGETLLEKFNQWGPLPCTWRSSSRDYPSGIWFYRVPPGLAFPERLGPAVELIRPVHRYAVTWPSRHPSGGQYRWYAPNSAGTDTLAPEGTIPAVADLTELPAAWIDALTGGRLDSEVASEAVDGAQADEWLSQHNEPGACPRVDGVAANILRELSAGTAHDSLNQLVTLARLAEHSHRGIGPTVKEIARVFAGVAVSHGRHPREAVSEFDRSWRGAVGKILATPEVFAPEVPCDCGSDPEDLVDRTPPPPELGPDGEPLEPEHTTWWPRDLDNLDEDAAAPPTVLSREDQTRLFYAGKVNGLLGESESGKTWVVLHAVAQELDAGHDVLYIDPEDTGAGIRDRLNTLGIPPEQRRASFVYINPEEDLTGDAYEELTTTIASRTWSLIVVDGVNAAMTLMGLDIDSSNKDATKFSQWLLRPLMRTGGAVVAIDHIPKNRDKQTKGGIGAQAKRAMITGCALRVDVVAPFGRGMTGKLKLSVDKDRAGHVRGASDHGEYAGMAVLTSDNDKVTVSITAPDTRPPEERDSDRLPAVMAQVSQWLVANHDGGPWSTTTVCKNVRARDEDVRVALGRLELGGYVAKTLGDRKSSLWESVRRYNQITDIVESDNWYDKD